MSTLNPEFRVMDTECGVMAGAYRPADEQSTYWRFTNFLLPFFSQVPPCQLGDEAILRAWVPMDDRHTMFFSITTETFHLSRSPNAKQRPIMQTGLTTDYKYLPNTTDWYGRWRLAANLSNDHMIDRDVQRTESYSGIEGLDIQDTAVTESMGPIVDHDMENLAQSDLLVVGRGARCSTPCGPGRKTRPCPRRSTIPSCTARGGAATSSRRTVRT